MKSGEYSESDFGLESFASAVCDICTAHIGTHEEFTHTHTYTHTSRHIRTRPAHTHTHTNTSTKSGNVCAHTAIHILSVCPSVPLRTLPVRPSLIVTTVSLYRLLASSCFFSIHPAYHRPTVSLPINAHRAALQWSWRVPRQQAQYRVYRHACTCQPGRTRLAGVGGGRERESKGEGTENMSSQAERTAALCHNAHIQTHTHACKCSHM